MIGPSSHAYVSPEGCFRLGDPEMLHSREGLEPGMWEEGGTHLSTFPGCPQSEPSDYLWGIPSVGLDGRQATPVTKP